MGLVLSLIAGFLPMFAFSWFVYWLDRYEKEPLRLLGGVFLWGAVVAAGGAFLINTTLGMGIFLITESETATELATGVLVAPLFEELLKGFAILVIFLFFRQEFDSILDGIVYAGVTALGFAATENTWYIYEYGYNQLGIQGLWQMVFIRVILVGWQHPFYTAFTGIGLALSRTRRNPYLRIILPILGLTIAILAHAIHNTLSGLFQGLGGIVVGALFDWTGWFIMFIFILWVISQERRLIAQQLEEEVTLGLLTANQYRVACSPVLQFSTNLKALFSGKYVLNRRFYQLCAELAHKKNQRINLGEEKSNFWIEHLRDELHQLSPKIET